MILLYTQQDFQAVFLVLVLALIHFCLWLLRNTPFRFLYDIWCVLWITLFAVFAIDYAKRELKNWWGKD
jgi:hypothetical protein